jgi:hypothetical protein
VGEIPTVGAGNTHVCPCSQPGFDVIHFLTGRGVLQFEVEGRVRTRNDFRWRMHDHMHARCARGRGKLSGSTVHG